MLNHLFWNLLHLLMCVHIFNVIYTIYILAAYFGQRWNNNMVRLVHSTEHHQAISKNDMATTSDLRVLKHGCLKNNFVFDPNLVPGVKIWTPKSYCTFAELHQSSSNQWLVFCVKCMEFWEPEFFFIYEYHWFWHPLCL